MSILVKLIADYAWVLYLLLAVVSIAFLRIINIALRERADSIFSLEREAATARLNRAIINLLILFLLGGGIFYVSNILVQQVDIPEPTPTPTPVTQLPPTPTKPALLPTPTLTATPSPQPTPVIEVVNTPTPASDNNNTTLGSPPNCPIPGVQITKPGNFATVSGVIQIFGSANVENFDYYKLEFQPPGGNWTYINSYTLPVFGGMLATWNSSVVPPGQYGIRLLVVDKTGNYPEPCRVTLIIR